jgi:hypothetical protein
MYEDFVCCRYWSKTPKPKNPIYPHSPNDLHSLEAIKFWLAKSDFYMWPHITPFDSWEDLLVKLEAADLNAISALMRAENKRVMTKLKADWMSFFERRYA